MIINATEFIMVIMPLVLMKLVQRVMPLPSMVQNNKGKHVLITTSVTMACVRAPYVRNKIKLNIVLKLKNILYLRFRLS